MGADVGAGVHNELHVGYTLASGAASGLPHIRYIVHLFEVESAVVESKIAPM